MKVYIVMSLITIQNQLISSQMLRQPPYLINRPLGEQIIESGNFISPPPPPPPTVITEPPCNSIIPIPNTVSTPSTTIITDCSPTICQNLANTIQLMIVCNLLQNSKSSDLGLQLVGPLLTEILPALSCGCNQLPPTAFAPSVIPPNVATPNISPNIYSSNIVSMPPRVVAPANGCACNNVVPVNNIGTNLPLAGPANTNGLLNTIMSMLGNIQG